MGARAKIVQKCGRVRVYSSSKLGRAAQKLYLMNKTGLTGRGDDIIATFTLRMKVPTPKRKNFLQTIFERSWDCVSFKAWPPYFAQRFFFFQIFLQYYFVYLIRLLVLPVIKPNEIP